ncbi:calcium-binding EF-hand domain-containing protein [Calocera viscosa TUFC12733]|uniref:Calcium-binding EF-hand domain-containing protein n=1 Tax=Calocera viscosa (strain TUFC12733) TaxID=1330018 RepID=A0A167LQ81_CALVF|nr:calcium-binding EF-hand domain-containing protein [Calocera viscosa TUFC12733]
MAAVLSHGRPTTLQLPKGKQTREASGVFSLFSPPQIQQFKEAFSLIDQDGDGVVDEGDLKGILGSLGIPSTPALISSLLSARPGGSPSQSASGQTKGVNFTMFLTMMGERLVELDPEAELIEAFESFDESDSGWVKGSEIRKWLGSVGDKMDEHEIDRLLKGPFTDRQGNFNYREWVKVLRVNTEPEQTLASAASL